MKPVIIFVLFFASIGFGQQVEKAPEAVEKMYFSADFEDGRIAPMDVGFATCAIDPTTGANGTKQSVKCTCQYTAQGTTSCSGGGGQAEISFKYSGDPALRSDHWESYWLRTDRDTANAAQLGPTGQIKVSLERIANGQNGWQLEAFGFVQNKRAGRLSVYQCDNGCSNVSSEVNIADGRWHRVVKKQSYDEKHRGCVTVWVDDMKHPIVNDFCSSKIGNTSGDYTLRLGIPYSAYSGKDNGQYTVWIDEVQSASHDLR